MEEFTDLENINLQEMSNIVLDSFCERYLEDAQRIINTGIYLPRDGEMIKLSLAIVMGLYYKRISDGVKTGDRVAH